MVPVVAAGVAAARKAGTADRSDGRSTVRWLAVTVDRPMADVRPDGNCPSPSAARGED